MDYVGGYVIFNDITARDIQRREMRSGVFSFCKAIDTFCPLGLRIVTPDEIPDPHDLAMELRVNGDARQTSHSGRMSTTIPEILPTLLAARLQRGDVVSTGTVSGVAGFSEDAARFYLKPGDGGRDRADRRAPQPGRLLEEAHGAAPASRPLVDELAARRREAPTRARADGRGGAGRAGGPRSRQRPLPDQLLGHEGLRRRGLPGQQGEPTPICLEASADDAARTAWTTEVRLFRGYDETDPRPPLARTIDVAREAASGYGRIGPEPRCSALRRPTAWSASRPRSPTTTSTPSAWRSRRGHRQPARARPSKRSSGCVWQTRSRRRPWSTFAPTSLPG